MKLVLDNPPSKLEPEVAVLLDRVGAGHEEGARIGFGEVHLEDLPSLEDNF